VFTGTALARETGKGTVKLDQPITSLLPEGMELPEPARKVTLEHLTTHTSGFPRLPAGVGLMALLRMATFGGDPYRGFDEDKMRAALRGVSLESEPGAKMEYSNFGTGLLGWLLANRAGKSYEDYIRSEVCQPLGMADTRVKLSSEQAARFAQGYRATLKLGPVLFALRSSPWELSNPLAGAGALRSNGPDMLRFLKANMHPDDSELGRAIRASQAERRKEPAGQSVAMNWMRTRSAKVGRTIIWHNGGTGGFRSFLGFTEDGQAGVVVLSNVSRSVDELGVELLKDLAAQTGSMTVN
jgi:serine-type D-Ala-D-Ala carboxypeptidase/endopeptidase